MLPFDPKKPLYGFTARFPHAKRRIHLFADARGRCLFFRPKNASDDWEGTFWTSYGTVSAASCLRSIRSYREWLREEQFFRVFSMPDPRPDENRTWQVWWRPGCGYAVPFHHPDDLEGAFFFCESKEAPSLMRASTARLRAHFEQEWNDPHSDVRAALPWCDLSDNERAWRSIRWECGGREEVETVALAGCLVDTEGDEELPLKLRISVRPRNRLGERNDLLSLRATVFQLEMRDSPRLERLFIRVKERNRGLYQLPTGTRDDWRFSWIPIEPPRSSLRGAYISFVITLPSQHERMEASLFLRGWLRENAPDLMPDWFPEAV